MKVQLGAYWDSNKMNYGQAITLMLTEWGRVLDILLDKDPNNMVILPWTDINYGRTPLTKTSSKQMRKEAVSRKYADNLFSF